MNAITPLRELVTPYHKAATVNRDVAIDAQVQLGSCIFTLNLIAADLDHLGRPDLAKLCRQTANGAAPASWAKTL